MVGALGFTSPKKSHFRASKVAISQCSLAAWPALQGNPTLTVGQASDPLSTQVFGLGNKTYEHFNAMGKYVDKRLEQLGAQRIFELGMGDDDGK